MDRTIEDVIADMQDAVRGEAADGDVRIPVPDLRLLIAHLTR